MANFNTYCQMQYWYIFQESKLLPNVNFLHTKKIKVFVKRNIKNFFLYASKELFITNSHPTLRFSDLNFKMKIFQICNELECGSLLLGSFVGSCKVSHINRSQLRLRTKHFPWIIFGFIVWYHFSQPVTLVELLCAKYFWSLPI